VLGDEWEYLLWIGVTTFGLNLIYAAFQWYGIFPIATTLIGFYLLRDTVVNRFPPQFAGEAAHEAALRARRQVSDGIEATLKRPNRRSGSKEALSSTRWRSAASVPVTAAQNAKLARSALPAHSFTQAQTRTSPRLR